MIKDNLVTVAMKKYGAFFVFSTKQFHEARQEGIKYVSLGAGIITPKGTETALLADIDKAVHDSIEADKEAHSKSEIIQRELVNHEAGYTWSIDQTVGALDGYGYTREDIQAEFDMFISAFEDG
jgi:hypothetical protein